ncbi:MAG: metallophosphoesterase [Polyangia bacterium]
MLQLVRKNLTRSVVATAALAALIGCDGVPSTGNGAPGTGAAAGSIALVLSGVPTATFNSFSYVLAGPSNRVGSIETASSSTFSALIGGVAAGIGYSLTLTGTSTDGQTTCSGASASFSVTAAVTTSVSIAIDCHRPPNTGSIQINGTINLCPTVDSVTANPAVGNVISLASAATDQDGAPQPLSYKWTASAGTLNSTTAQSPTLTCAAPGPVSLTLTVSDGDPGCAATFNVSVTCPSDAALNESAWVEIGPNNQAIARLLTPYNTCPSINVDGVTSPMNVRAVAGTMPLRPTSTDATLAQAMTSGNSKPSVFTNTSCELLLSAGAASATVAGIKLPLPKPIVNRVAIIGDTGCRISIGNVYQACSDPTQWPFPVIAQAAAAMQPDLVLHVGDYHYRDNPCPPGNTACAGTPWGYGSDVWDADLFTPAAPLLKAAPWVMVRGNHETCNRAGQGWYRYLDPNPFDATGVKTCNDPSNDNSGNYNDPWAVSFGDTQLVLFDSANTAKTAYAPAAFQPYTSELAAAAALATPSFLNIWAVHHPVLGYSAANPPTIGNAGLQSVMNAAYPGNYYPPNVGIAIHGHVHDFQALDFASNHPATFVAGNGGDNLDTALPATFNPNGDLPAAGTVINAFAFSQEFGFMIMDRVGAVGAKNWKFTSYRTNGTIIAVCTMAPPAACSGVCDSTPGTRISCTDGSGNLVGTYDNIP